MAKEKLVALEPSKKPARGAVVAARTPRGTVKYGKFVKEHETIPNGKWWEIKPIDGGETWRSRPGSVSLVM